MVLHIDQFNIPHLDTIIDMIDTEEEVVQILLTIVDIIGGSIERGIEDVQEVGRVADLKDLLHNITITIGLLLNILQGVTLTDNKSTTIEGSLAILISLLAGIEIGDQK